MAMVPAIESRICDGKLDAPLAIAIGHQSSVSRQRLSHNGEKPSSSVSDTQLAPRQTD